MHITKLRILNFLGCELLELDEVGQLTVISGPNGAGKSTILRAVATLLGGSRKQPGLLRLGADEGEVYAQLSDGTEIARRITSEGAREAVVKDGKFHQPIKSPEGYLKRLLDALALDPVAFVSAEPKRKVQILLETFPVAATIEEVREALPPGVSLHDPEAARFGLSGAPQKKEVTLPELDRFIGLVRETRTSANGARTKAQKTVEQMRETLPPAQEAEVNWPETVKRLRGLKEGVESSLSEALAENQALEAKDRRTMEEQRDRELEKVRATWAQMIATAAEAREKQRQALRAEEQPTLEALAGKIAQAEERSRQAAGAQRAREIVDGLERDLEGLTKEWKALDESVGRLEELKVELCGRIPIAGVEVDAEGLTVRDGHGRMVRFESLNTAEQVKFAVRLAMQRSGELKAILCDGLERLDPHAREAFLAEAKASGCQFLVAMATDDEGLTVKTEGGEPCR